jgi:hypothetical protein
VDSQDKPNSPHKTLGVVLHGFHQRRVLQLVGLLKDARDSGEEFRDLNAEPLVSLVALLHALWRDSHLAVGHTSWVRESAPVCARRSWTLAPPPT